MRFLKESLNRKKNVFFLLSFIYFKKLKLIQNKFNSSLRPFGTQYTFVAPRSRSLETKNKSRFIFGCRFFSSFIFTMKSDGVVLLFRTFANSDFVGWLYVTHV